MKLEEILYVICMLILIIIPIALPIGICSIGYKNNKTETILVKDKYVKTYNNSGTYLVVGDNGETYEIEDLFFIGKFNSTDLYNQLEIGKTYTIETTGYRIRFLSKYRNINKITEE